ncbi:MAG TPA: response regulator, partial [Candidatus Omnitrophica bacterium]|nr:response regulator [Candidatus Omnitrophota bacterium]
PDMDGVEATKQIMAYRPTPILILTASHSRKKNKVFQAISFGALDVLEKTNFEQDSTGNDGVDDLIEKIKLLSKIKVIRHPLAKLQIKPKPSSLKKIIEGVSESTTFNNIVVIAASTGGPQVVASILAKIPPSIPAAILVVQHIARGFDEGFVEWLSKNCPLEVKIPRDNQKLEMGTAYVAPTDTHMVIYREGIIGLTDDAPCGHFKPSADVLFESAAKNYGSKTIGVILTGMGKDGVSGIKTIKQLGGRTIAQNEESCVIYGMPKEAIEAGNIDKVLPPELIAEAIIDMVSRST